MNSDVESLQKRLKAEKITKGEVASKFKAVEKNSEEHSLLLTAMQTVSERIKSIESQLKNLASVAPPISDKTILLSSPFANIAPDNNWNSAFHVQLFGTEEFSRWDDFLKQHRATYHYSAWLKLIKKSFGHESTVIAAIDDENNVLGGLPLTFFSSKIFGRFAVSVPFLNYGGIVSNYFNVAQALMTEANAMCIERKLSHIEIRTMQADLAKNALDKKVSMVLQLPKTDDLLEKQLGTKLRAQYKKAEAHEPIYRVGKSELLNDFYAVFSRNMRDLGTPVYSKNWFSNILLCSDITSAILVVYMDSEPVSAGFLVGNGAMLEIPWASTIHSANHKNANMWMYRQILSYAIREGYEFFDFGRSTLDAGTYKFKKQWGALPYQHYWYYLLESGKQKPELNPDNPKFKLFILIWKLMPVWLTKIIGPLVIKHIP